MLAIELEGVSKRFRLRTIEPATTLKTAFVNLVRGRRWLQREPVFQALRDITFTISQGETFGIIGRNGSGKSTLLKLIAGIYRPDSGRIRAHGRVAGLLELGAGFHPEFSGRENIFINGIVLGLPKREVRRRFDDIVRFAELEAFIDEPVRIYSAGMFMRLGFAVAVHTDPDIFLIDEILAVGDEAFQLKCADKLAEFRRRGKTIVLVSHDLGAVERWCDQAIWLDEGTIQALGDPTKVTETYRNPLGRSQALVPPEPAGESGEGRGRRWGTRDVEITSVRLMDAAGRPRSLYACGDPMMVEINYHIRKAVTDVVFGIAVLRHDGLWCYGTNTDIERIPVPPLAREGVVRVVLESLPLLAGSYYLDVAVHPRIGEAYDYHSFLYPFEMTSTVKDAGICRIPHRWVLNSQEDTVHGQR